jgi:hypothetical protein
VFPSVSKNNIPKSPGIILPLCHKPHDPISSSALRASAHDLPLLVFCFLFESNHETLKLPISRVRFECEQ